MKNKQDQSQYGRQFNFYQQKAAQCSKNCTNQYNDFVPSTHDPIISKLEINFPQMKICQSRKDINEQSLDFSMTSQFRAAMFKQENFTPTKNILDKNDFSPFTQFKKHQRHRSPVRFNENSYSCQETTKQDYDQNNTSYHDFFKVPQNLNLQQPNKSTKAFPGTYQQFDTINQDLYKNQEYRYSTPKKNENLEYQFQAKTQTKNYERFNFSPQYKATQKFSKTQQKPKLKENMTLSQLLSDLQHRSQKLYQMYGENNDNHQKCVEKMQQNQKDSFINPPESKQIQNVYQTKNLYQNQEGNLNNQGNLKNFESKQEKIYFQKKIINPLITEKHNQQYQKPMFSALKQSSKFDRKKKKVSFQSSQLCSNDLNFEETSRQKASTNFYFQEGKSQIRMKQKMSKIPAFMNKLTRFFTMHLLKILKPKFYYQTGVLSTESNIQVADKKLETSQQAKLLDKSQDRSKQEKDISFFQQYFKQQGKVEDYVIAYGVEKKSQRNLMKKKSREQKNYLQVNDLLPIEEQLQSEYGASMRKSPQRITSPIIHDSQTDQLCEFKKEKDSKLQYFMNTNENVKMGQLLIQSVNRQVFEYCLNPRKNKKNIQMMNKGFQKISEVMKYKILTLLRHIFLMIKFHNPNVQDKQAGLSSLRISSASLKQKYSLGLSSQLKKEEIKGQNLKKSDLETQNALINQINVQPFPQEPKKSLSHQYQHQPRNILQHYYKKISSPNSQTNEYASILKSQTLIAPNNIFYQKSVQKLLTKNQHQFNQDELRKSRFNPALTLKDKLSQINQQKQKYQPENDSLKNSKIKNPSQIQSPTNFVSMNQKYATTQNPILQQEYYGIPYQESQSKIQRNRLSRAVSYSNTKTAQSSSIYKNNNNVLKQSIVNMKQSKVKQGSKIMNENKGQSYGISINDAPIQIANRILPGGLTNQYQILPQRHARLDMYNKTGKISRSYSQNDFQHYYQHNTNSNQQQLRISNAFQQEQSKNQNVLKNIPSNPLKVSNTNINQLPSQSMRRSSVSSSGPSMNQNLKISNAGLSSSIFKNNQLKQSQMNQQGLRSSRNSILKPNIPTIRPIINPSIQKKRCYSVGSFLNGPSLIHGLNSLSNNNSAIKELQAMPFIQYKQTNSPSLQNQMKISEVKIHHNHHIAPQNQLYKQQQNVFMNNIQGGIPMNMMNAHVQIQNRPRMSKSMDNFVMRPISYSGFNQKNINLPIQSINMNQQTIPMYQSNVANPYRQLPNISKSPNYPIINQPIISSPAYQINPPIKLPNKQIQVDSEYHMLKPNTLLYGNNQNINNLPVQQIKRSNVNNRLMRKSNQNSGRGSCIMYEQQNLIANSSVKPNMSPQYQNSSPYINKPTSPRNVIYSAKSTQHKQMISPQLKKSNIGIVPQQIPNGVKTVNFNQHQVTLQSTVANTGKQYQQYNQPTSIAQTNLRISKSRSPQLPTKVKSPQITSRLNNKPNLQTIKNQRLGSYGQY